MIAADLGGTRPDDWRERVGQCDRCGQVTGRLHDVEDDGPRACLYCLDASEWDEHYLGPPLSG